MTTEIRFEDEELDARALVDEVGAVTITLRLDDRDPDAHGGSYVSVAGSPTEVRRVLVRLLGATNAIARAFEDLAALEQEPEEFPGLVSEDATVQAALDEVGAGPR